MSYWKPVIKREMHTIHTHAQTHIHMQRTSSKNDLEYEPQTCMHTYSILSVVIFFCVLIE